MKKPFIVIFPILVVGLVALFYINRSEEEPSGQNSDLESEAPARLADLEAISQGSDQSTPSADSNQPSQSPIVGRRPYNPGINVDRRLQINGEGKKILTEGQIIAERLHSENSSAEEDLETIEQILSLYRLSFQQNPVAGDNQMVMEALTGENPHDLIVFPNDHPDLDQTGQLLDRWKTPYFFHAISGTQMEIFSAGPDKSFNTSDDVQHTTRNGNPLTGQVDDSHEELFPQ